ncbi:hypothetical protein BC829DRAFT_440671 [Chytridium lagenaria]|nr:hypothetical protein BC829DRAFT_440671 [Chytridium lagenaria]
MLLCRALPLPRRPMQPGQLHVDLLDSLEEHFDESGELDDAVAARMTNYKDDEDEGMMNGGGRMLFTKNENAMVREYDDRLRTLAEINEERENEIERLETILEEKEKVEDGGPARKPTLVEAASQTLPIPKGSDAMEPKILKDVQDALSSSRQKTKAWILLDVRGQSNGTYSGNSPTKGFSPVSPKSPGDSQEDPYTNSKSNGRVMTLSEDPSILSEQAAEIAILKTQAKDLQNRLKAYEGSGRPSQSGKDSFDQSETLLQVIETLELRNAELESIRRSTELAHNQDHPNSPPRNSMHHGQRDVDDSHSPPRNSAYVGQRDSHSPPRISVHQGQRDSSYLRSPPRHSMHQSQRDSDIPHNPTRDSMYQSQRVASPRDQIPDADNRRTDSSSPAPPFSQAVDSNLRDLSQRQASEISELRHLTRRQDNEIARLQSLAKSPQSHDNGTSDRLQSEVVKLKALVRSRDKEIETLNQIALEAGVDNGLIDHSRRQAAEISRLRDLSYRQSDEVFQLQDLSQRQAHELSRLKSATGNSQMHDFDAEIDNGAAKAEIAKLKALLKSREKEIEALNQAVLDAHEAADTPRRRASPLHSNSDADTAFRDLAKSRGEEVARLTDLLDHQAEEIGHLKARVQRQAEEIKELKTYNASPKINAKVSQGEVATLQTLLKNREEEVQDLRQLVHDLENRNAELEASQILKRDKKYGRSRSASPSREIHIVPSLDDRCESPSRFSMRSFQDERSSPTKVELDGLYYAPTEVTLRIPRMKSPSPVPPESPSKQDDHVARLKKELANARREFKSAQDSLSGVLAQTLEAHLKACMKQISDFNKISNVASEEVQRLRSELEEQTYKLRLMESYWRRNKDEANEETLWMSLIEEERVKWRKDVMSFETRTRNLQDQIEGMETVLAEKEMEVQRLKELLQHASAKIKDPKLKTELGKVKAVNAGLEKENQGLKEAILGIKMERDSAANAIAKMTAETSNLMDEIMRRDQSISQMQNAVENFKQAFADEEEKSVAMRSEQSAYLGSMMKAVCESLGISQAIPEDLERLREEFNDVLSSALGIREFVASKVGELDSRYSADFQQMLSKIDSESKCVVAFAEKVSTFKTKYRSLRDKAEQLNTLDRQATAQIHRLEAKLDQLDSVGQANMRTMSMNDAAVKMSEERAASAQVKMAKMEEELRVVTENAAKEQRLAAERVEELLEEQRQVEILEKHCNTIREQRLQIKPQQMDSNDYEQAILTNEKLRADFNDMRRVLEEKESEMQQLRSQISNATTSLQHSKKKATAREERYKRTIVSAIDYLEHFNGKMSGMENAISLLKSFQ